MKTISKHDGKNYEIDGKGDLHEYPDGSIFEVKDGKLIPGKGGGNDHRRSAGSGQ